MNNENNVENNLEKHSNKSNCILICKIYLGNENRIENNDTPGKSKTEMTNEKTRIDPIKKDQNLYSDNNESKVIATNDKKTPKCIY